MCVCLQRWRDAQLHTISWCLFAKLRPPHHSTPMPMTVAKLPCNRSVTLSLCSYARPAAAVSGQSHGHEKLHPPAMSLKAGPRTSPPEKGAPMAKRSTNLARTCSHHAAPRPALPCPQGLLLCITACLAGRQAHVPAQACSCPSSLQICEGCIAVRTRPSQTRACC